MFAQSHRSFYTLIPCTVVHSSSAVVVAASPAATAALCSFKPLNQEFPSPALSGAVGFPFCILPNRRWPWIKSLKIKRKGKIHERYR
jgi:hypothetical protein